MLRKYVNVFNRKYNQYGVCCLLKLVTNTNKILNTLELLQNLTYITHFIFLKNYYWLGLIKVELISLKYVKWGLVSLVRIDYVTLALS